MSTYNIYCDESCHLEHDGQPIMAQGAVWCRVEDVHVLCSQIHAFKLKHHAGGELKWVKVSPSRLPFYLELVEWFIHEPLLHFRAIVVQDKSKLDHTRFNQGSHDTFYYKMYFSLLSKIISPDSLYNIYLDIKDTRSREKIKQLHTMLCYDQYDFTSQMISTIKNIRSEESELMQFADFLLGAVSYRHRGLATSTAKSAVVKHLEELLGRSLTQKTALREEKLNIFPFQPKVVS